MTASTSMAACESGALLLRSNAVRTGAKNTGFTANCKVWSNCSKWMPLSSLLYFA